MLHQRQEALLSKLSFASGIGVSWTSLQLEGMLGEGGFARVLRAKMNGNPVAVKIWKVPETGKVTIASVQLFLQEAELMRQCENSSTIRVLGLGLIPETAGMPVHGKPIWAKKEATPASQTETPSGPNPFMGKTPFEIVLDAKEAGEVMFMVLELCEGGALKNLICRQLAMPDAKLFTWSDRVRWLTQVAEGMMHVENAGIMHKDLKLDNILLDSKQSKLANAKLADFGLASRVQAASKSVDPNRVVEGDEEGAATPDANPKAQALATSLLRVTTRRAPRGPPPGVVPAEPRTSQGTARRNSPAPSIDIAASDSPAANNGRAAATGTAPSISLKPQVSPRPGVKFQVDDTARGRPIGTIEEAAAPAPAPAPGPPPALTSGDRFPAGSLKRAEDPPTIPKVPSSNKLNEGDKKGKSFEKQGSVKKQGSGSNRGLLRAATVSHKAMGVQVTESFKRDSGLQGSNKIAEATKEEDETDKNKIAPRAKSDTGSKKAVRLALGPDPEEEGRFSSSRKTRTSKASTIKSFGRAMSRVLRFSSKSVEEDEVPADPVDNLSEFAGTLLYLSPQALDNKKDPRMDVFAYGITLYEIIRGMPFGVKYQNEMMVDEHTAKIKDGWRPEIPPKWCPELVSLVEKCWAQSPEDRPKFSEVVEILRRDEAAIVEHMSMAYGGGCCTIM